MTRLLPRACLLAMVIASVAAPAGAQIPCQEAYGRVHAYMAQVRAIADGEAYGNIPMRCGWNGHCRHWHITRLNAWVGGHANRANLWLAQIRQQCLRPAPQPRAPLPGSAPIPTSGGSPAPREPQTTTISIPTTPEGYRP